MRLVRLLGRALGALVLVGLAALAGFAAPLLRPRKATSYAATLRQPVPQPPPDQQE
ncbi:MAG: hypothetical protein ACRDO2_11960 [Nocardioidaceae bacterium]